LKKIERQDEDKEVESKPIFSKEEFSKEQIDLINLKREEILTRPSKEGEFRFLIIGDENSQKPLLSKLLRVEQISWPPKTQSILYNTLDYKMKIDVHEYKFQLYFLSNIKKLRNNSKLFNEACKKANGVIIFYNPVEPEGFTFAADMGKKLRDNNSELEIILTSGSDNPTTLFYELKRLEEENEINNSNDYNSLISEVMINTLNRKIERNKEIQYSESKLKELQEQLFIPEVRRDFMEYISSREKPEKMREIQTEKIISSGMANKSSKNMIFISYSHKDSKWLERVTTHLKPLKKESNISLWSDKLIKPGEKWEEKIYYSLNSSKVAILLVSADFLASDFITNNELPPLLEAAEKKGTTILPVFISDSRFDMIKSISQFQAINDPKKPLLDLTESEQEKVFVKLCHTIENAFKSF